MTSEVPALGRPMTLGMLWDARKDELIPGTLWSSPTLQEHTNEILQRSSAFETSACDSIESRCSLLGLEASLKASFLSGHLELEGSAKYLTDQKTFKNQSRVTLQYKATTICKILAMTIFGSINEQQRHIIEKSSATHVVTRIVYGANALFVFDSEKLDASKVKDIQGSMHALVNKITVFEVNPKLTEDEKDIIKKFSCKFYGDFILDRNPTTFEEAVKTIIDLPKILKEKGECAVPMKVSLMPLEMLGYGSDRLVKEISIDLLRKIEDTLEVLKEMKERCNESLADVVVKDFPQIKEYLNCFLKVCNDKISELQRTLKMKLPSIRDGKEDESSLKQVFQGRDNSPFSHKDLSKWLDYEEREINIINFLTGLMKGIKIIPNQSELDREVLAPGVVDTFCFVFTSLESADRNLDAKTNFLNSLKYRNTHEDPWCYSKNTLRTMREKAKTFYDLYSAYKKSSQIRFFVAALPNRNYKGAGIYHYMEGTLVTDSFSKPDVLDPTTARNRRDFLWYFCDLTLDPDTASNYLTLSEGNKKATCGKWQKHPDRPEKFDPHPQVLCSKGLTGRHYWEVEWSTGYILNDVGIAVAYKEIGRKGKTNDSELGCNNISWYFGTCKIKSSLPFVATLYKIVCKRLTACHDNEVLKAVSPTRLSRVGVYLDWPAGTLSFYHVSSNSSKLVHLATFHTKFTEPVYPGFYVCYRSNYIYLCPASQML